MLPWIQPARWAPDASSLIAEAAPLRDLIGDDVGLEVWGALGGHTAPEARARFRASHDLLETIDNEAELLAHRPLVARCLARLASAASRGRYVAGMSLMSLASDARTAGVQTSLLPLDWLERWAPSPLSSIWPFADEVRARVGGVTRTPSYGEVVFDYDLYSSFMERADAAEGLAEPLAPVSLRVGYEPMSLDDLPAPGASWRVSGELDPSRGGAWWRLRRAATGAPLGAAGVVPSADGVWLEFAFEPLPRRHDYAVEIAANLARHALLTMGLPRLRAGLEEAEAFLAAGFTMAAGGLALEREACRLALELRGP